MKIKLFEFIDDCVNLYENNLDIYNKINIKLINFFIENYQYRNENITSVYSRIKSSSSVREKLFRNKFYLKYDNCEDVIDNLNDIVGLTIECRFIKDEADIFNSLYGNFVRVDNGYYQSKADKNIYLDLNVFQPQLQRNGFPIYRIDGYYHDVFKVNFELQIKAMVHSFWSDIEHQVVYKNNKLVYFNSLITKMLSSIRDNLDVVDNQLEVIYSQITGLDARQTAIGITPESFKLFVANSINELVSESMIKSIGVATDFKKCSAILSQFIYITQFVNCENPSFKMIDYFEHLNFLRESNIDFTEEVIIDNFKHEDVFCDLLGNYWMKVINTDYDWHVFFIICFALQTSEAINSFKLFVETIRNMVIPTTLIKNKFKNLPADDREIIINFVKKELAEAFIENGRLEIVHENNLFDASIEVKKIIDDMDFKYQSMNMFNNDKNQIKEYIHFKVLNHRQIVN